MKKLTILYSLFSILCIGAANANWEYGGGYYDDGERFTIGITGGAAWGMGKIKNQFGELVPEPYWADQNGMLVSQAYCGDATSCQNDGYEYVGLIDLADLDASKKFQTFSWAYGLSAGWAIGGGSHWRISGDWLHIGETNYNSYPMFQGQLESSEGFLLDVASTGVYSTTTTDVFSMMFYYDFFDGYVKQRGDFIPYVGFGFGYANSETKLDVTDLYGDLSDQDAFWNFGEDCGGTTLCFYESKTMTNNFSASVALGFSYGLTEYMFLDGSIRATWVPNIKWGLNNEILGESAPVGVKHKDIFSAENVLYTTAMLGLRFEF
ncbi:MAG: hypothetical protein LBR41_00660 [Rickettsiales bacterium]|jgi:hypothetical protein|nr:hypothetical protein [Rickettsiales bacterium]